MFGIHCLQRLVTILVWLFFRFRFVDMFFEAGYPCRIFGRPFPFIANDQFRQNYQCIPDLSISVVAIRQANFLDACEVVLRTLRVVNCFDQTFQPLVELSPEWRNFRVFSTI